ncbi:Oligopeptide transporter 5 [Acorus calamus]|uniref:Oligopeptide transporter 5 n=1 Tax=Acorus calamus TaxID=4465 RepID=A0AAV9CQV7_ACOCL|nr:Oligopeptide transporter 5 [Acorus calamus]
MAAPTQREECPAMADEIEESPIEEVRLTIPNTDDPTLPTLTFRTWVLGISSCVFLAFVSQILAFRQTLLIISPICLQLLVLPFAKLMAKTLPTKPIRIPFTKWKFSMNPGPFNMKEHALIYTLTSSGYSYPGALSIITQMKLAPLSAFLDITSGYLYSGKPLANMMFSTYGDVALTQANLFINDFKLCHYMKIPPRSMFLVQNICEPDKLPKGSNWTCPDARSYYMNNIIWGLVGPSRVFFPSGLYSKLFLFFIVGAISPVPIWVLARSFPHKKWIELVNIPIIFVGAATMMPPIMPMNYWSWFFVGIIFNYFVFKRYKGWWAKYNYVMSNALDAGSAFMALLVTGTLQSFNVYGVSWWGLDVNDHCPLATCPTAPGVVVDVKRLGAANGGCDRDTGRPITGLSHPTVDVNRIRSSDAMDP